MGAIVRVSRKVCRGRAGDEGVNESVDVKAGKAQGVRESYLVTVSTVP